MRLIPLKQTADRSTVFAYTARLLIAGRHLLKQNGLESDDTIRYTPEWDDSIGGDRIDDGLRVDLNQEGEVVPIDVPEANRTSDPTANE